MVVLSLDTRRPVTLFLTGTYAFRGKNTGIAPPVPLIIPEDTYTLPDMLKQAGYKTAVVGKWHLGLGSLAIVGPQWNDELKPGPRGDRIRLQLFTPHHQ